MSTDNQGRSSSEDSVSSARCRGGGFQWLFGSPLRFIVGGITLFSAGIGIWQWIDNRRSVPSISANLWDCQCEVQRKKIAGFKCFYTYQDQPINDLWTARITLVNTCSRNIIGVLGGDLMSTNISFRVDPKFHIIALETEENEFGATICFSTNLFSVAFEKWRPGCRCTVKLFCERSSVLDMSGLLAISVVGDPLKQGVVQVNVPDGWNIGRASDRNLLALLPPYISGTIRWCGIGVYGLIFGICIIILIFVIPWIGLARRKIWQHNYGDRFDRAKLELKDLVLGRGYAGIPDEFWCKHQLPKPVARLRFVDNPTNPSVWMLIWMALFTGIALSALIMVQG